MSKRLVVYFSASGVTTRVAGKLADVCNRDLYEITPAEPYTRADLDWTNKKSRSSVEMADPQCRPRISGCVENMAEYEAVFVGFPIWWGREPSVVDTFLDQYDFSGKKIIPFCTSGGSGIGKTAQRISSIVGEKVSVDEGKRLSAIVTEKKLKSWVEELGL